MANYRPQIAGIVRPDPPKKVARPIKTTAQIEAERQMNLSRVREARRQKRMEQVAKTRERAAARKAQVLKVEAAAAKRAAQVKKVEERREARELRLATEADERAVRLANIEKRRTAQARANADEAEFQAAAQRRLEEARRREVEAQREAQEAARRKQEALRRQAEADAHRARENNEALRRAEAERQRAREAAESAAAARAAAEADEANARRQALEAARQQETARREAAHQELIQRQTEARERETARRAEDRQNQLREAEAQALEEARERDRLAAEEAARVEAEADAQGRAAAEDDARREADRIRQETADAEARGQQDEEAFRDKAGQEAGAPGDIPDNRILPVDEEQDDTTELEEHDDQLGRDIIDAANPPQPDPDYDVNDDGDFEGGSQTADEDEQDFREGAGQTPGAPGDIPDDSHLDPDPVNIDPFRDPDDPDADNDPSVVGGSNDPGPGGYDGGDDDDGEGGDDGGDDGGDGGDGGSGGGGSGGGSGGDDGDGDGDDDGDEDEGDDDDDDTPVGDVTILQGSEVDWYYDARTDKWMVTYGLPDSRKRLLFEATVEQVESIFGEGARPESFERARFETLINQKRTIFGGDISELEGEGQWEDEVRRTIALALDNNPMPDWVMSDDGEAYDLLFIAEAEDKSDEWLLEQMSDTKSFRARYAGIEAFTSLGLGTGDAVDAFLEYEGQLKTASRAAGGRDGDITPEVVGELAKRGYSTQEVAQAFGTFRRLEDNRVALEAFNDVLVANGLEPMGNKDMFDFLAGNAPADYYEVYEAATFRESAITAGLEGVYSADDAIRSALANPGITSGEQTGQAMQRAAQLLLRFRSEVASEKFGISQDELVDMSLGEMPRSGRSAAEIQEAMDRALSEAQSFVQKQRVTPFTAFSQGGTPQARSLSMARTQS